MPAPVKKSKKVKADPFTLQNLEEELTSVIMADTATALVSTNDVNLKIMELLDVTSFVRYGMTCKSTYNSMRIEMDCRSKRLRTMERQVNILLNGPFAEQEEEQASLASSLVDENAPAFLPTLDDVEKAKHIVLKALQMVDGCFFCKTCIRNDKFPLFREERGEFANHTFDIFCVSEIFFNYELDMICKDANVLESQVVDEQCTLVLLIKGIDMNYMSFFRSDEFPWDWERGDFDSKFDAYWNLAQENGSMDEFTGAARRFLTPERLPAFRIAAWRATQRDPSFDCAFATVISAAKCVHGLCGHGHGSNDDEDSSSEEEASL
jgi:hypothetical protein